jgi:hypothetical protein
MNVGIVAEGPTDQRVLEHIIVGALAGSGLDVEIRDIQPIAEPSGATSHGGWELVFAWLRRGDYRQALQLNDLIVIQIDTDVCDRPGFDVERRDGGVDLVARVIERLRREIDATFLAAHGDRLVFAIAEGETECWLLPLVYDNNKAGKTSGCEQAVVEALKKKDEPGLRSKDVKDPRRYRDVARPYRKHARVEAARTRSPSLDAFIADLSAKVARLSAPATPRQ